MNVICECGSLRCRRAVNLDSDQLLAIHDTDCIVVVDGCDTVPDENDRFIRQEPGYQIWTNGEKS